ncbi:type VII secretion protein EccB [Streptomyces sp. 3N207]|uniref:type VII secretion protein EccB n=1 Tax=Streptomyces sp. 3N207 TaxID=3457417 RepID=UPI003FD2B002
MQSRRDQVQAHMFIMGRLTSGMLRADPDAPESPQGRTNRGITISILIAVLICAGAFVFGLLKPGTKESWRDPGMLIVNKDTGARYLYLGKRLRPVRNYTSARLLAGAEMKVMSIGGKSLRGTPRGAPVGISGAPDEPPAEGDLSDGKWQVCSGSSTGSTGTTLAVGSDAEGQGLKKTQGLLASGPDKDFYLVWQGRKLRLDQKSDAPEALGYGSERPLKVSDAFLNSLPTGPDLTPPEVSDQGAEGPRLDGRPTRIGEVFKVAGSGGTARYYLLQEKGLTRITATGAALVLGDKDTKEKTYQGRAVAARKLGTDALSGQLAPDPGLSEAAKQQPSTPPDPAGLADGRTPCVGVRPGAEGTRVSVTFARPADLGPTTKAPPEKLVPACVTVHRTAVPPGGGALVHALGAGGGDVGDTLYLVTDTGMKYRVPSGDGLKALGYNEKQAQGIPSALLSMLPTGPDLTRKSASKGRGDSTAPRCADKKTKFREKTSGDAESATSKH